MNLQTNIFTFLNKRKHRKRWHFEALFGVEDWQRIFGGFKFLRKFSYIPLWFIEKHRNYSLGLYSFGVISQESKQEVWSLGKKILVVKLPPLVCHWLSRHLCVWWEGGFYASKLFKVKIWASILLAFLNVITKWGGFKSITGNDARNICWYFLTPLLRLSFMMFRRRQKFFFSKKRRGKKIEMSMNKKLGVSGHESRKSRWTLNEVAICKTIIPSPTRLPNWGDG